MSSDDVVYLTFTPTECVRMFSPLFEGSDAAWAWVCDVTNGRQRPVDFSMTDGQQAWAKSRGYLPK